MLGDLGKQIYDTLENNFKINPLMLKCSTIEFHMEQNLLNLAWFYEVFDTKESCWFSPDQHFSIACFPPDALSAKFIPSKLSGTFGCFEH